MVTIEKCKEVLNVNDSTRKLTNEEVKIIRDFLYKMSIIEYERYKSVSTIASGAIHKSIH